MCIRDSLASVVTIVTTDFEALYAYKHGDYQRCLQLTTPNVRPLLYAVDLPTLVSFRTYPEFIQLMDDDVVSLTALLLIVSPECREQCTSYTNVDVSQLTVSVYLMTQCQLKLRHSVTSLTETLDYIEVAQRRHLIKNTLNQLILKLAKSKVLARLCSVSM